LKGKNGGVQLEPEAMVGIDGKGFSWEVFSSSMSSQELSEFKKYAEGKEPKVI